MKISKLIADLKSVQKKHPNIEVGVEWASFESPDYAVETHIEVTPQVIDLLNQEDGFTSRRRRVCVLWCHDSQVVT